MVVEAEVVVALIVAVAADEVHGITVHLIEEEVILIILVLQVMARTRTETTEGHMEMEGRTGMIEDRMGMIEGHTETTGDHMEMEVTGDMVEAVIIHTNHHLGHLTSNMDTAADDRHSHTEDKASMVRRIVEALLQEVVLQATEDTMRTEEVMEVMAVPEVEGATVGTEATEAQHKQRRHRHRQQDTPMEEDEDAGLTTILLPEEVYEDGDNLYWS